MNIVCYLQKRIYIRPILKKTPYELWKGCKLNISYFHPFGCQCFILNTKENLEKFDSKSDIVTLLGCSETSKAYRVYNSRTLVVEEAIHMKFNDTKPDTEISELEESCADLKLDDGIMPLTTRQTPEADTPDQALDNPQEVREPTR